jgi:cyclopropane fatty-acyl-phospholipid synthase-like methyltransferase
MSLSSISRYTSPAGKECTLAAARLSGVNPSSTVLDLGCGYGEGACTLAAEFRCKITAIDISEENIAFAQDMAVKRHVSHLITFKNNDILKIDFKATPVELILAEGGVLSFIGRQKGIGLVRSWLIPRGWFAFSDLIRLSENTPREILSIFEHDTYHYETEKSYRQLIADAGFDVHFMSLVPPGGWDDYYAHMARRLEDKTGFFSDQRIKLAFHREIDVFYRFEAFRYIGYLFCIARAKD